MLASRKFQKIEEYVFKIFKQNKQFYEKKTLLLDGGLQRLERIF